MISRTLVFRHAVAIATELLRLRIPFSFAHVRSSDRGGPDYLPEITVPDEHGPLLSRLAYEQWDIGDVRLGGRS